MIPSARKKCDFFILFKEGLFASFAIVPVISCRWSWQRIWLGRLHPEVAVAWANLMRG